MHHQQGQEDGHGHLDVRIHPCDPDPLGSGLSPFLGAAIHFVKPENRDTVLGEYLSYHHRGSE